MSLENPTDSVESTDGGKTEMYLAMAESVLSGETIFADSALEGLESLNEQTPEIQETIEQLPAAEIHNMLNKAAEISLTGDIPLARNWLSASMTNLARWVEAGSMNPTDQTELLEKHRVFTLECIDKSAENPAKALESTEATSEILAESTEVRKLRMLIELGEDISTGRRLFADTIYEDLYGLSRQIQKVDNPSEGVSKLLDTTKYLLETLPVHEMNNLLGKVDEHRVQEQTALAQDWLNSAITRMNNWDTQGLLSESTRKTFAFRIKQAKQLLGVE